MWDDIVLIVGRGFVLAESEEQKTEKRLNPAFTHNNTKVIILH
jgi:hypothetical protein